jgi:hypothetical protein
MQHICISTREHITYSTRLRRTFKCCEVSSNISYHIVCFRHRCVAIAQAAQLRQAVQGGNALFCDPAARQAATADTQFGM